MRTRHRKSGSQKVFTFRRALVAFLLSATSGLISLSALGFAATNDFATVGGPQDLPDFFRVAAPRAGDSGVYKVFEERRQGDNWTRVSNGFDFASFTHLGARILADGNGTPRLVHRIKVGNLYGEHGDPKPVIFNLDPLTGEHVAFESVLDKYGRNSHGEPLRILGSSLWFPDPTIGWEIRRAPCGLFNAFQVSKRSLVESIDLLDAGCLPGGLIQSRGSFRVAALGTIDGRSVVGFDNEEYLRSGKQERIWFAEEIPYPVLRTGMDEQAIRRTVIQLAQFTRGNIDLPQTDPRPASRSRMSDVDWKPVTRWGPNESGITHPFPASEAFRAAVEAKKFSDLRDYFEAHPRAKLVGLRYQQYVDEDDTVGHSWWFAYSDGTSEIGVCSHKTTNATFHYALPKNLRIPANISPLPPSYQISRCEEENIPRLDPEILTKRLPSVRSMFDRWRLHASGSYASVSPNAWGFRIECETNPTDCENPILRLEAGYNQDRGAQTEFHRDWSMIQFRANGSPEWFEEYTYDKKQSPSASEFPAPQAGAERSPKYIASESQVRVWEFPGKAYVAGSGLLALLTGIIYWFWPTLKKGLVAGLFSRIVKPEALRHPVRGEIAALVEAQPGIHYQEMVRRLNRPRGTITHHLRKLVRAGLVRQAAGPGYTCYFPAGAFDRRTMQASPFLKSMGARNVFEAVQATPGASLLDIARTTKLSPPTVHYHMERLKEAGLVVLQRDGRKVRAHPSADGRFVATS